MRTKEAWTPVGGRPSFAQVAKELDYAQKPGDGVPAYSRWVNRRAARVFAAAAVSMGVGPNAVTLISACLSVGGLLLLVTFPASWGTGFAAAVLLALGYVMDSADGQVARATGTGSPAGEWLDHVIDAVRTPALHVAVFFGFQRWFDLEPALRYLPLAFALLAVGHFTSQILAEQLSRHHTLRTTNAQSGHLEPAVQQKGVVWSLMILPIDTGIMCWIFIFWGSPAPFLASYVILFFFGIVFAAVSARRKYVHLKGLGK